MNGEHPFAFADPGPLIDGDLSLVLVATEQQQPERVEVPTYRFAMRRARFNGDAGFINLRVGNTENIVLYRGHIGYGVEPEHRGHYFAARACTLLLPLARRHDLTPLWITCDPDNVASRKTCERIGATLVETIDVPEDAPAYRYGARRKCRYRLDL
jgi:tagatose 1,6-diphosphate aldolase